MLLLFSSDAPHEASSPCRHFIWALTPWSRPLLNTEAPLTHSGPSSPHPLHGQPRQPTWAPTSHFRPLLFTFLHSDAPNQATPELDALLAQLGHQAFPLWCCILHHTQLLILPTRPPSVRMPSSPFGRNITEMMLFLSYLILFSGT